ncbi:EpsG family protein [Sphingobacterium sp. UBA5670]|uniref:EpsG family protein n=1 Tax=Sphingobacterium sp. UBA5670 TaxID=1947502 RepID=UPI0025E6D51B|nr:EpsG family protein [Sphingobacterium sp. UBA5670]
MYLYVIYFVFALLAFFEINRGKYLLNKVLIVPFLVLFSLASLRWERGTDWGAYIGLFENVDNTFYLLAFEPGFYYVNYLVAAISDNYTIVLVIQALIIYTLHFYIFKKYSLQPYVSLMIWFGFYMGSIFFVRFNVAVALTLFSFIFIEERKFWRFFACVIIAFLFHRSAILFIPAYFLYNKTFTRRQILLGMLISFFLSIFFEIALNFLGQINLGIISEKAMTYAEAGSDYAEEPTRSAFQIMIVGASYRILILLLIIGFFYDLYKENITFRGVFNLYFAGMCIFVIITPVSVSVARMAQYYEYFQFLLIPFIIMSFKYRSNRNLVLLCVFLFYLMRLRSNVSFYEELYVPYKSIFNKELPTEIG